MQNNFSKIPATPSPKRNAGFTIIELLIATAVFSVVLLVFLSAFLRISELFYKGINLSNTQETARNVIQNITSDIQFYHLSPSVSQPQPTSGQGFFCVGDHRYTYNLGTQYDPTNLSLGANKFGMIVETAGCVSPAISPPKLSSAQQLLDPGMQLNKVNINCNGGQCSVGVHLVYYSNDNSVLYSPSNNSLGYQAPDALCTGPPSSSQYCATADYTATILQSF